MKMKTSDLTDSLFEREMGKLLSDAQFFCARLSKHIAPCNVRPEGPFPLAVRLKPVWDYARGTGPRPRDMQGTIQSLCELLWSPIAGTNAIPASWWKQPLGYMSQLAWSREELDEGLTLTVDQLALLGDCTRRWVQELCRSGEIPATSGRKNGLPEWHISPESARTWLEGRQK